MDDPRDILKAAGVECAEVEVWASMDFYRRENEAEQGKCAILALARLVAKQATDLKKAETFIALLKGMVEQLEDEGEYDFDELLKRVRDA